MTATWRYLEGYDWRQKSKSVKERMNGNKDCEEKQGKVFHPFESRSIPEKANVVYLHQWDTSESYLCKTERLDNHNVDWTLHKIDNEDFWSDFVKWDHYFTNVLCSINSWRFQ